MSLFAFLPDTGRALYILMILGSLAILSSAAAPLGLILARAGSRGWTGGDIDLISHDAGARTFVSTMPNVRHAALNGLRQMGMNVTRNRGTGDRWTIVAVGQGREVSVELASVSPRLTRMGVIVAGDAIRTDRAPDVAIFDRTAEELGHRLAA
jgi:hypothetical protein